MSPFPRISERVGGSCNSRIGTAVGYAAGAEPFTSLAVQAAWLTLARGRVCQSPKEWALLAPKLLRPAQAVEHARLFHLILAKNI
jgi:hypothetical protein